MTALAVHRRHTWFGHPSGLTVLFLTQMWAEFSFFGLQALLVYYMTQRLGMSQPAASLVYGIYGGSAFFSPLIGGFLADRILGRTRSIVAGGVLMMLGHFAMAFEPLLYPALALVALGNGLFIPALAVQVSGLYAEGDGRRAQAFSLYYMGINLGGLLAPLVCGTLGEKFGWHWGFAAAGVGMLIGLLIYWAFYAHLPPDPIISRIARHERARLSIGDRSAIRLLFIIGLIVILFRIGYEQSGNIIALWIQGQTDRHVELFGRAVEIPATWFQSINPLLIILLTPFLMRLWGQRAERVGTAHLMRRMGLGCAVATAASLAMVVAALVHSTSGLPVSPWWIVAYFVLLTIGELHVLPVGLSLFGTLAPMQIASVVMGAWYIAKFLGSVVAGVMGTLWLVIPPEAFFGIGAASTLLASAALYWMGREPTQVEAVTTA
ncbi:MAG: peptide MFS transporter [Gammaproteobacteria bacterium]